MPENEVNKNGWFWLAPEYFNRWRVFPRAFIVFYFWLTFETAMWFMGLPVPGPSQAAFASAIVGAGAAWFGLYVNSGPSGTTRSQGYQEPMPVQNMQVDTRAPRQQRESRYDNYSDPCDDEAKG